jgi:hypothetical protein
MSSTQEAEAHTGLYAFRSPRDGNVLVFDERHPGEGYVQFFSPARGEFRKFLREAARTKLERITDAAVCAPAFAAYLVYRATLPALPAARPSTRSGVTRGIAPAVAGRGPELQAVLQRLDVRDPSPLFVTGRAGTGGC